MSLAGTTAPTVAEFEDFPRRFSNWNRWGSDDVLGRSTTLRPRHGDQEGHP